MTYYEYGFLSKCAEYGVAERDAGALLKIAQQVSPDQNVVEDPTKVYSGPDDFAGYEGQVNTAETMPTTVDTKPVEKPVKQPVAQPLAQPAVQPAAQPAAQSVTQPQQSANDIYSGMSQAQKDSFQKWWSQDGQGNMVRSMFKGQDGKVDRAALDKFLTSNSKFITGSDEDRKNIVRQHFSTFTPEQQKAFRESNEYKSYRQAATNRFNQQRAAATRAQTQFRTPLPKGWVEMEDANGNMIRVQRGAAAEAAKVIGQTDAYAKNFGSNMQPGGTTTVAGNTGNTGGYGTRTVRRTYSTPSRVPSFRKNMNAGSLTSTPINRFKGQRGDPNSATFYRG